MRLILKEYLTLLKESKELDALLPDLLLSIGYETISLAQIGATQYGVDIAAIGKDSDDIKKMFLFTIKQGDIGRNDWCENKQAVKQSLDQIRDVYLNYFIPNQYKKLPVVIIVCTGGKLKQELNLEWNGYLKNNESPGKRDYVFWDGDRLSLLIEENMLNENILPENLRSLFRRTLVKLTDSDYNFEDFYQLLSELMFQTKYDDIKKQSSKKEVKKMLRTVHLSLNIIYFWARKENNLKPALYCAERTILIFWEFIRINNLFEKEWICSILNEIYQSFQKIYIDYFVKIQKHCYVLNGFSGHYSEFFFESINIFEHLGIIVTLALNEHFKISHQKLLDINIKKNINNIVATVKELINNNQSLLNPVYDNHMNEISATIFLLSEYKEFEFLEQWIRDLFEHIWYSYTYLGMNFPIYTDSIDDLIALNISKQIQKEKLFEISSLIPSLAQWCIVLNFKDLYKYIKNRVTKDFENCTMQLYYPDIEIDKYLYSKDASRESGFSEAPIILKSFDEMKKRIAEVKSKRISKEEISSIKYSFTVLPFIAFRHFRTPMFPMYWQDRIEIEDEKNT